ncbi:MAG: LOG family protein, partial [Pseudonocardiales bacterium]
EMFEALTLVQTNKVTRFPVILYGTQYWQGLIDWIRNSMLAEGKVGEADLELLTVTDDVDEIVARILASDGTRSEQAAAESRAVSQDARAIAPDTE